MSEDIDRQFVAAARSWIGTPWVHQGRARHGVDCIGLVVMAAADCGLDVTMDATYGHTQAYWQAKPLLLEFCERVSGGGEGIVALYKNTSILHVGVLTESNTVVHAFGPAGRVVESGLNFEPLQFWRPRWAI